MDFKREQLRQLKIEQREMTIEIMNFEEKKLQEEIERRMAEIERLRASRKAQTSSQATQRVRNDRVVSQIFLLTQSVLEMSPPRLWELQS